VGTKADLMNYYGAVKILTKVEYVLKIQVCYHMYVTFVTIKNVTI
jgi:hypothetical protein